LVWCDDVVYLFLILVGGLTVPPQDGRVFTLSHVLKRRGLVAKILWVFLVCTQHVFFCGGLVVHHLAELVFGSQTNLFCFPFLFLMWAAVSGGEVLTVFKSPLPCTFRGLRWVWGCFWCALLRCHLFFFYPPPISPLLIRGVTVVHRLCFL